jgi:CHAT domain-containing protein
MGDMPRAEQKVTLQVLWQSADAIRVTPFKEGSVLESTVKASRVCPFHSALVADRARDVLALLARANAGDRGLLGQLESAGQAIYLDLLPAFLKEKLEEASARNLVLHLDRQLLGIPWELLHDGDAFLGRRFRIGRLVSMEQDSSTLQRRMAGALTALVVADPCGDLPAARREAEQVGRILEDAPVFGEVTTLIGDVSLRTFRDELARHDVLHFAGHAEAGNAKKGGQLLLKDGPFTTKMIDQLRGRVDFPGLVFLNGCSSSDDTARLGADADPLGGMSGIASALLLAGVRHVVGTLWDVRDEVARRFAAACYKDLGQGATIGASLEAARLAVIDEHGEDSLLWADHLLYGDPTWAPAPAGGGEAFEDSSVLDGLEARYRNQLLSDDAGTRLLAAAMLLRLGDLSVIPALGRDMGALEAWLAPDAPQRSRRSAALVVQALAAAAGLSPGGPPDELPDVSAVRALYQRLVDS